MIDALKKLSRVCQDCDVCIKGLDKRNILCESCAHKRQIKKKHDVRRDPTHRQYFAKRAKKLKERSQSEGCTYDLDADYLMSIYTDKCPFLGIALRVCSEAGSHDHSPSVDRIDPTQGYIKGNVRWVSKLFNGMKQNLTDEEMLYFCQKIVNKYKHG